MVSRNGRCLVVVGTMWSTVAKVRSGKATRPPAGPQHVERLRAGDLVDEVQADEELCLSGRQLPDGVGVPHFLKECLTHNGSLSGGGSECGSR